jgi:hypothetical protein
MTNRFYYWIVALAFFAVSILTITLLHPRHAQAQTESQYPVMDKIADKVIQKYQSSTCEQLWMKKSQQVPPSPEEQRAVGILKNDPQMQVAFINKIAPSIANKMFDCGMIP